MKKAFKYIIKLAAASTAAVLVLFVICCFYYNLPVHYTNEQGYTDYLWEPDKQYYKMTEGFGRGKTNNEGLMNTQDYNGQRIGVLLIGSSQIEGQCVKQSETVVSYYNSIDGFNSAYSIGVSGHDFCRCVQNLDKSLERYRPEECAVIEISDIALSEEDIENALNNEIPRLNSVENKYVIMLEKIPLLRHAYNQLDNALHKSDESVQEAEVQKTVNTEKLEELMQYISSLEEKYDTRIIILYHQAPELVNEAQTVCEKEWSTVCEKYQIEWLSVCDDFEQAEENGIYCYGFLNTLPQQGHLNKNGNKIIAERLYEAVNKGER